MRVLCLQHEPAEDAAAIVPWLQDRGHRVAAARLYAGDALPAVSDLDWLVVMGGSMSAHDEAAFDWMAPEKRLIEAAIKGGRLVLGICLGAQLVADVLGARVYRGAHREIGWHQVRATEEAAGSALFASLPPAFTSFHWHGDTFDIPAGAVRTAESDAFAHQAFEQGSNVAAIQFHPEATPASVAALVDSGIDELTGGRYVQTAGEILGAKVDWTLHAALLAGLLERLEARGSLRGR